MKILKAIYLIYLVAMGTHAAAAETSGLRVDNGWVRVPPPGAKVTAAYMNLHNEGTSPLTIKSISVAGAGKAELHATTAANGMMSMHQLPELTLAPKGAATLAPGGMHVMIFDVKSPLKTGDQVDLTLHLSDGREVTTKVSARAP